MQNIALCFPKIRAFLGIPPVLMKSTIKSDGKSNDFVENFLNAFRNSKIKGNGEVIIHKTKPLRNI